MKLFPKTQSSTDTNTTWLSSTVKYRGIPLVGKLALERSILKGKIKNNNNEKKGSMDV